MSLGAYSIVRYSNNLSDQRINLGVVVWHPIDGFECRFTPSLDRVKAIDPRLQTKPLRAQLDVIEQQLRSKASTRETLAELASWFRHGLEVTEPYPAKMHSLIETIEHFYELLVCPVEEFRRKSSQRQFEGVVQRTLNTTVQQLDPHGISEDRGLHRVNGVSVQIGIFTEVRHQKALWRAVSLQSLERPDAQLAKAKATALDIQVVRGIQAYRHVPQIAVLQEPKPDTSDALEESIAWLKREANEVLPVRNADALAQLIPERLMRPRVHLRGEHAE